MTYTTPDKYSDGETMSPRKFNPQIVDNIVALYSRLVHEVAVNYSTADWTITTASGGGYWETDTSGCTITLTPEETSTCIVVIALRWTSNNVRALSAAFRVENTTSDTYSDSCGFVGQTSAGMYHTALIVGVFTGVSAGSKIFRLNGSRYNSADTVVVSDRIIAGVAISTA